MQSSDWDWSSSMLVFNQILVLCRLAQVINNSSFRSVRYSLLPYSDPLRDRRPFIYKILDLFIIQKISAT